MAWKVKTPPVVEPVSLAQAKLHLKLDVDLTEDDTDIAEMITTARETVEDRIGRALITQTITMTLDGFPYPTEDVREPYGEYRVIKLPQPPLQSVSSVKYIGRADALDTSWDTAYDGATRLHTLNPAFYRVDTISEPGRVVPIATMYWPFTELPIFSTAINSVQIEFIAGYGDSANNVPTKYMRAMKLAIGDYYENRLKGYVGTRAVVIENPQFYNLIDSERMNLV